MNKSHEYVIGVQHDIAITPLLQSHMLEFSSNLPFKRAMDLLKTAIPSTKVNASQAQRLMQHIGHLAEMEQLLQTPGFEPSATSEDDDSDVLYLEVDGGHILTDEGFRETKVGRLFSAQHINKVSSENEDVILRSELSESDYLAHLGHYKKFVKRFNPLVRNHLELRPNSALVAISDGADWIAHWLNRDYPQATVILDFYHASEKLCEFATLVFNSSDRQQEWIAKRKEDLLSGQVDKVILAIRTKACGRRPSIVNTAEKIIQYYDKNRYRMHYDEYRKAGYCIGSGAIESAISTVVQQRCKLVGQRWTKRVKAILNLRAAFKSDKRSSVRHIINHQMGYKSTA